MIRSPAERALAAVACAMSAVAATAAPELLANGGGEQPVQAGWTLAQGSARTTGLIRNPAGTIFAPDQGLGFIVLGPGPSTAIAQAGNFPFGSQRLVLTGSFRTPDNTAATVTIRAFNSSGTLQIQRSIDLDGFQAWGDFRLTYAIPPGARTWDLTIQTDQAGTFGVHADALTLIGTCVADFNGDRLLNFFDITTYLALFQAQDPEADLTGNGTIDFFDISRLLEEFQFTCD